MKWKDATAMAQAVNQKQVSVKELVQESIDRIEKLNPALNAVVSKQYEEALKEAEKEDYLGKPFAGVPFLLKDLGQNEKGQPSSAGSRLLAGRPAGHTDTYVQRLKDLGFIIVGRTNTPEFGFKNISDASLHGPVNLPLDPSRNAGGSSGGAAAALASGMVSIAAASDGGGSIRIPASFNGLIGLKTSRGRIPVGPKSYRGWQGASSNFALTKSVRDTKRLLYHLQTYQVEAPFPLALLPEQSLFSSTDRSLKIAYSLESPIGSSVSTDAQQAVLSLLPQLEALGHQITELSSPILDGIEVMQAYYLMNSVETAQMFEEIEAGLGRSMTPDDMEVMTWAIYQSGQTVPAKLYSKVLQDWDRYSASMADFHQRYDLLLTPTVADVAPKLDQFTHSQEMLDRLKHTQNYSMEEQQDLIWQMFEDSLALTPFTQQANICGQPAISLPTYVRADGLPIGIQLTAAKGREDLLLQLADQMEAAGLLNL
ncbi:TPA: amidase [Streptococcus suis]|uniref:amidase n=1 Tax=Streptococcus suis TaxID=1307 RepID=UPI0015543CB6|nr:amidase [Streptococcus suis]MBO4112547.1 amidase [Streptococcus suis]MBS8026141.1 amidase [Streptococcus suis]MCO8208026.1 amidase [Streptococcus suis]MCO8212359.1 amidase [Streptococcus suis]NQN37125.1 amidase [Streptococcus suis]